MFNYTLNCNNIEMNTFYIKKTNNEDVYSHYTLTCVLQHFNMVFMFQLLLKFLFRIEL